ncbi:MAG: hypothetical protein JWP94_2976 [Mucilaginibacter sp.]|nr:hypothetical protein [Mucilaginibacter sp.]
MNHINSYIYTPIEIQLANEIANRLKDPAGLSQFLKYTKEVPHEILRQFLNNACSVSDNYVEKSRAAIFVSNVKKYKLYGDAYPRN